ncbi:MAG: hypothetical protein ACR2H4_19700 [Pyrinomonadaceae bacterium]
MRSKKRSLVLLASLFIVTVAAFAVMRGQPQNNLSKISQQSDSKEWPVTDYTTPEAADSDNHPLRKVRNRRYDSDPNVKRDVLNKLALSDSPFILDLPLSHGPGEPALPVAQSDIIVLGRITDSKAHLSNDRTNIYSEFSVAIEEVIKDNPPISVTPGAIIATERRGGAVRFHSGKVLRLGSLGKNAPQVAKRYILFLSYSDEGQAFPIITGYELRGGKVFPLDGLFDDKGSIPQFEAYRIYNGTDETPFLNTLRSIVDRLSQGGSKKGGRE